MSHTIAALFVSESSIYKSMPHVDPWDQRRDARTYRGRLPVVCHPPCQLWGNFAFVNYARYGGEHNRPGNDGGCFAGALHRVESNGGVLEHPAFTRAWNHHGIARPRGIGWTWTGKVGEFNGYTCEVWQSAYGHRARKRTWLYYVGQPPHELRWERRDGTHQIGWHDQRGKERNKTTLSKKEAIATPPAFAEELLKLAAGARRL